MPTARSAAASSRSPAPKPRPKGLQAVGSIVVGLRWDRVGRIGLLVVFVVVSLIGVQRALSYRATQQQAGRALALVRQLKAQNAQLAARQRSLSEPGTIAAIARSLGMVRIGEHPYSVVSSNR